MTSPSERHPLDLPGETPNWVKYEGRWYYGLSREALERKCEDAPRRRRPGGPVYRPYAVETELERKHGILAPLTGREAELADDADRYYLRED